MAEKVVYLNLQEQVGKNKADIDSNATVAIAEVAGSSS